MGPAAIFIGPVLVAPILGAIPSLPPGDIRANKVGPDELPDPLDGDPFRLRSSPPQPFLSTSAVCSLAVSCDRLLYAGVRPQVDDHALANSRPLPPALNELVVDPSALPFRPDKRRLSPLSMASACSRGRRVVGASNFCYHPCALPSICRGPPLTGRGFFLRRYSLLFEHFQHVGLTEPQLASGCLECHESSVPPPAP